MQIERVPRYTVTKGYMYQLQPTVIVKLFHYKGTGVCQWVSHFSMALIRKSTFICC